MKSPSATFARTATILLIAVCTCVGCSSWPFLRKERTSIITPSMRIAAVRETAARAPDTDIAEQQQICENLARQIQTESDPLVRQEIQNTVAAFNAPLAQRMLLAGLTDDDVDVRLTCCYRLAERAEPETLAALKQTLQSDSELDVRLAAIDAIAQIESTDTVAALGSVLSDRDPAVQYAAVQALKSASGKDLGNDVNVWQEYIANGTVSQPEISVAERIQQYSPF